MRYFTPELLARCRSLDEDVAEAAAAEWEKAIAEYRTRLEAIRPHLPRDARRLMARVNLHDAKVIAFEFGHKRPTFSVLLQLEGSQPRLGKMVQLSYHVVAGEHGGVKTKKHGQPGEATHAKSWVLYDEFNVDEERAFFTHSLLLSDGREIEVRFHNLRVRSLEEVVTPPELAEEERHWLVGA
jgi:hypothetical protein